MNELEYILLFFGALFAGIVDSVVGGGGLITIPLYLNLNIDVSLILGTNKLASFIGTTSAVTKYYRQGHINFAFIKKGIPAIVMCSLLGAYLSRYFEKKHFVYFLILIIPVVLYFIRNLKQILGEHAHKKEHSPWIFPILILIAFYDGLYGPGTGSFNIVALAFLGPLTRGQIFGTGRLCNWLSNLGAIGFFLVAGKVHFVAGAVAAAGSLLGNYLGPRWVKDQRHYPTIQRVMQVVLAALLVKSVLSLM